MRAARGVGETDVFPGHADDPPGQVARVGAAIEHAAEPVERGIGRRAADRLVQRRDLVVERVAPLVEAPQVLRQRRSTKAPSMLRPGGRRSPWRSVRDVEQSPRIAIGETDQARARVVVELRPSAPAAGALEQLAISSGVSGFST
jgi:hypothetical protein